MCQISDNEQKEPQKQQHKTPGCVVINSEKKEPQKRQPRAPRKSLLHSALISIKTDNSRTKDPELVILDKENPRRSSTSEGTYVTEKAGRRSSFSNDTERRIPISNERERRNSGTRDTERRQSFSSKLEKRPSFSKETRRKYEQYDDGIFIETVASKNHGSSRAWDSHKYFDENEGMWKSSRGDERACEGSVRKTSKYFQNFGGEEDVDVRGTTLFLDRLTLEEKSI